MSHPRTSTTPYLLHKEEKPATKSSHHSIIAISFLADGLIVFFSLVLAYYIRFETGLAQLGINNPNAGGMYSYVGHFWVGVAIMMAILVNFRLYERRNYLSYGHTLRIVWKSAVVWGAAYTALTLILKISPFISRMYCGIALMTLLVTLPLWRAFFSRIVRREEIASIFRERALIVGWSPECNKGVETIGGGIYSNRLSIAGVLPPPSGEFEAALPKDVRVIGRYDDFETLIKIVAPPHPDL